MKKLRDKIKESVNFISKKSKTKPDIAIILGTGLNDLVENIEIEAEILYKNIPYFSIPTVTTHEGKLLFGNLSGKSVVAMQGRCHYYEGYSLDDITFPVRVMKELGADILIVSNVSGGLNPLFKISDLMLITDHINFTGLNPLVGPNDDKLGPRFPDMYEVYDKKLIELAEKVALKEGIKLNKGVYIGVIGPNLETKAEYRMMRNWGGDAVGMSTVPEVIVAVHAGFRILGISCITDMCLPDALKPVDINKILKAASDSDPRLSQLIMKILEDL